MKKIILTALTLMSFTAISGEVGVCICNADVGYPGNERTEETLNIEAILEDTSVIEFGIPSEEKIIAFYQCLKQKNTAKHIYKINKVSCKIISQ